MDASPTTRLATPWWLPAKATLPRCKKDRHYPPAPPALLGYTMQVDEGNHYLMNKEEIENKIATLTGGRAAEEVKFGSITTGASNDIEQATRLARAMLHSVRHER